MVSARFNVASDVGRGSCEAWFLRRFWAPDDEGGSVSSMPAKSSASVIPKHQQIVPAVERWVGQAPLAKGDERPIHLGSESKVLLCQATVLPQALQVFPELLGHRIAD